MRNGFGIPSARYAFGLESVAGSRLVFVLQLVCSKRRRKNKNRFVLHRREEQQHAPHCKTGHKDAYVLPPHVKS